MLHTVEDVVAVARWRRRAEVTEEDLRRVKEGRRRLESLISKGYLIYGVTTSFGPLCNRVVPKRKAEVIQWKLVVSHASNAGELLPEEAVRAGMYCRLLVLLKGSSGVRPEVVELLAEMLNREVTPAVPELGSVGASGDLGHLAHIAAVMAGEGEAFYRGELLPAAEALRKAGLKPVKLSYKEGLALINGTSFSCGLASLAVYDMRCVFAAAMAAAALSCEALTAVTDAFSRELNGLKQHPGQRRVAELLSRMLEGSRNTRSRMSIMEKAALHDVSALHYPEEVQDAYSVRCTPQVAGAALDAMDFAATLVERELNSVSDNPVLVGSGVYHGGNFHGQHVSLAMDLLTIAAAQVTLLSERRLARLLDEKLNLGLPAFLSGGEVGVDSGFMGLQYAATAAAAELRALATPMSVQSITTNACNQDYVSFSTQSALRAWRASHRASIAIAVELIAAAQACELRGLEKLSPWTRRVYEAVRRRVKPLEEDRSMSRELRRLAEAVRRGEVAREAGVWLW